MSANNGRFATLECYGDTVKTLSSPINSISFVRFEKSITHQIGLTQFVSLAKVVVLGYTFQRFVFYRNLLEGLPLQILNSTFLHYRFQFFPPSITWCYERF